MLVGYSSSSDEEEEGEEDTTNGAGGSSSNRADSDAAAGVGGDSFPVRKKLKTEKQLPKTRYKSVNALERMEFFGFPQGYCKYLIFSNIIEYLVSHLTHSKINNNNNKVIDLKSIARSASLNFSQIVRQTLLKTFTHRR